MEKSQRNRIIINIKKYNQQYLNSISGESYQTRFSARFDNLTVKTRSLMRKEFGSRKSMSELVTLGRLIVGFQEDIKQNKANKFEFVEYRKILSKYLINYLDTKLVSNYDRQCASYGETLFVLYLDLFITATICKTHRDLQANPSFLINPATGATLEIDVLFEDFKLAFEFQGEHHYTDRKTINKDLFKLHKCQAKGIILIPVNISQLNSRLLQTLIVNSIKDYLGIHDLFTIKRKDFNLPQNIKSSQLLKFCKLVERLHTSTFVFNECANWLDNLSAKYISNMQLRSPISSTTCAPKQTIPIEDLDIEFLYRSLKHVANFRKKLRKRTNNRN